MAYVTFGVVSDADSRGLSLGLAAIAGLAAGALGALARGVWNARRWATSPALTWQVLQGFVGAYAIYTGDAAVGAAASALAISGGVALVLVTRGQSSAGQDLNGLDSAVDHDDGP